MGQRSQIYIRFKDEDMSNKKGLVALYYNWNFGERMISRTRQIIEEIISCHSEKGLHVGKNHFKYRLKQAATVNFDMRTVEIVCLDIFGEIFESPIEYKDMLFNQDNNDGCLFVDVQFNQNLKKVEIKYALTDWNYKPLVPEEYMKWDNRDINSQYYNDENRKHYYENCQYIKDNATLMTKEEIDEFVHTDYALENAFDYDNLMFQYHASQKIIQTLSEPVKTFDELEKILKGANLHVLYRIFNELNLKKYY